MPMPGKHTFDEFRALQYAAANPILGATKDEVHAALAQVDQGAHFDRHRARYEVWSWDRTSPINGVAPEHFLNRPDVPDEGTPYLIAKDGTLIVFQPHHPEHMGHVPIDDHEAVGGAHADAMAAQDAWPDIWAEVVANIHAARREGAKA